MKLSKAVVGVGLACLVMLSLLFIAARSSGSFTKVKYVATAFGNGERTGILDFGGIGRNLFAVQKSEPLNNISCGHCDLNYPASDGGWKEYDYFTDKYRLEDSELKAWVSKESTKSYCDGKIVIYNKLFGTLSDVVLNPGRRQTQNKAKGGEELRFVLNQSLDKEKNVFNTGFLEIDCKDKLPFTESTLPLLKALANAKIDISSNKSMNISKKYAIAVRRQDYANLHNWFRDIYNTFLLMMHFNIQPKDVSILFLDAHPAAGLDTAWEEIYGKYTFVGQLSQPVYFQNFIIGLEENEGPASNFRNEHAPYLEEFRSFVLSQYNLDSHAVLNCTQLRITIIIRRNAVYHPRNVQGNVGRKIFNEAVLVKALVKKFPDACIKPVLMETLPMALQLDVIRQTDILIGMHGAGMSHVSFLPQHASLLELFSKGFKTNRPWYRCFHSITKWRKMKYDSWENFDSAIEMPSDFTILPTDIIVDKAAKLAEQMCPK